MAEPVLHHCNARVLDRAALSPRFCSRKGEGGAARRMQLSPNPTLLLLV